MPKRIIPEPNAPKKTMPRSASRKGRSKRTPDEKRAASRIYQQELRKSWTPEQIEAERKRDRDRKRGKSYRLSPAAAARKRIERARKRAAMSPEQKAVASVKKRIGRAKTNAKIAADPIKFAAYLEKERVRSRARHAKRNKVQIAYDRQRRKRWKKQNPHKVKALEMNRRALLRMAGGTVSSADIADIFKLQRGRCGNCRCSIRDGKYHADHIKPLARGGANNRRNTQLLCGPCNLKKHAQDPIDFMRQQGRLL